MRAWTITKGTKAPQAAAVIHTDFEKGFIKAEVMSYLDFTTLGSEAACREVAAMGNPVSWETYPMQHSVCLPEILAIGEFIAKALD